MSERPTVSLAKVDLDSPVPRYVQAKTILAEAINRGDFPPGSKLPNTGEISVQVNVSLITAHKAIQCLAEEGWVRRERGRGTFVRDDFRLSVAVKPQFRVGLVLHPSNSLGDFYHGTLITAIREAAERIEPVGELVIQRCQSVRDLPAQDADGLLCFHPDRGQLRELAQIADRKPILVLGASIEGAPLNCVDSQNAEGTRAAVRHLVELGHRRIAIVNGPLDSTNCLHRFEGYLTALQEAGITPQEDCIFNAELAKAAGAAMGRLAEALRSRRRPTAIIAAGYYLALEVLALLRQLRIRVPEEISLVGFDDTPSAPLLDPPLTTIRQPLEEMGMQAYARLARMINGENGRPRVERLPTTLVKRLSTGPATRQV
ncbi:MAG TPA: GntR family transcriptional regulator [Phycisphaerae bacterium]|nr:GntR family transcriptional regulator [Phycisphaerae bacterium]HRY68840.1 GntR family transcriptional regulator [Phycisphaerae bacterium]HSA27505.1 GntR family transcriptional regulator [Phycisphaerae bacterium]